MFNKLHGIFGYGLIALLRADRTRAHCMVAGVRLSAHLEKMKRNSPELFEAASKAVEAVSREENHPSASLVTRFIAHCIESLMSGRLRTAIRASWGHWWKKGQLGCPCGNDR